MPYLRHIGFFVLILSLSACSKVNVKQEYPKTRNQIEDDRVGKLTGDGIFLVGGKSKQSASSSHISVNSYLWRAALDNINFMPLNSSDSLGGVIVTDWYSMSQESKERYKVNIFIAGTELRADALKVSVYKQKLNQKGEWGNQFSDNTLAGQISDRIIERARELKVLAKEIQ